LAKALQQYRSFAGGQNTMLGLLRSIGSDGRVHAGFNPMGAVSGRFSSSGPNLQNIPRALSRPGYSPTPRDQLRSCFVASSPEHRLVVADYNQMELRAAAIVAGDQEMISAFRRGEDLHNQTAATALSKEVAQVTKSDRHLAKRWFLCINRGRKND
jgi:DNA polymerase-1